ncbi:MAG: HNH endonuclease, partial [Synechococcales cyanobacterium CRU_2_2]|nr:HNH endonuclease [Synechococcales cyanobacterium CRU_2_2]
QYPWLSLNFANLWVICQICNREKGERHWFEYEQYILTHHPDRFENLLPARPNQLIKNLRNDMPQI